MKPGKRFSCYVDDHLHVVDQRPEVSCLTQTKGLETLKTEEQKEKLLQKLARQVLNDFYRNPFRLGKVMVFYLLLKFLMWPTFIKKKTVS